MLIFNATTTGNQNEPVSCRIFDPSKALWLGENSTWVSAELCKLTALSYVGGNRFSGEVEIPYINVIVEYVVEGESESVAEDEINANTQLIETDIPIDNSSPALIVEDGSIVPGACSYVSLATARSFAASRGLNLPSSDSELKHFLLKAVDYLESKRSRFQGAKVSSNQFLQWPRIGVSIDGSDFSENSIPVELCKAQTILASEMYAGLDLMPTKSGSFVIEETVGPMTTKFSERLSSNEPVVTSVDALLAPLFGDSKSSGSFLKTLRV